MNVIEIKNIHLQIGKQLLLENEEMTINEGYIHVIMGERGSGKTTLLHEISLLSHISHANYNWNGVKVDSFNDSQRARYRRNHIGYILQDLELISEELSLKDNIDCMFALSGQDYNENKVKEYMEKMKLHCSLEQKVEEMSRGERQRFALVLALIKDVDLMILDEPTSALDMENTIQLIKHLQVIARDYHKMIVIASHDDYIGEIADVLYRIKDQHLLKEERNEIIKNECYLKNKMAIKSRFFKIYKKSHRKVSQLMMKVIYIIMIIALCIVPVILDSMLVRQQELFKIYANNEIIVVNTKEKTAFSRYDGNNDIFQEDMLSMFNEIKHVKGWEYYWQLEGVINEGEKSENVLIVPKKDIQNIIFSSQLASQFQKGKVSAFLTLENKDYEFEFEIENYDIKDYPLLDHVNQEVIYMPLSYMKELLKNKGITSSSSVSIECDDIKNVDETMEQIQRWLDHTMVISDGIKYQEQIENLERLQKFVSVLRVVLIIGIIVLVYVLQTIENKAREKEISHLRINGMNKNVFYRLYYHENKLLILLTMTGCLMSYMAVVFVYQFSFSLFNLLMILITCIVYIIITRIVPLFVLVQHIFSKDISQILRD